MREHFCQRLNAFWAHDLVKSTLHHGRIPFADRVLESDEDWNVLGG
jgi:hypothetical protein